MQETVIQPLPSATLSREAPGSIEEDAGMDEETRKLIEQMHSDDVNDDVRAPDPSRRCLQFHPDFFVFWV